MKPHSLKTAYNFTFPHPRGVLLARLTPNGLAELLLPRGDESVGVEVENTPMATKLAKALERYFEGRKESFQSIALDLDSGTPFQPRVTPFRRRVTPFRRRVTPFRRRVWMAAREIPWGETVTYGELARRVCCNAPRAVGQALGANPVPIIVPCHRILAAGGALGGFTGGLEWKRELLRVEKVTIDKT